jgi:dGTPase
MSILSMSDLAAYAVSSKNSRGRNIKEKSPLGRSEFQRDRDRIIHSSAFRRLEYKTQVFVNHEGDLFRTRLTHSLEVAQIGRSVARSLRLNEDLVEAIALAHDLGHTPFGHAGQEALNKCMKDHNGFEHNLQSLRVVDTLEERYGAFDGLNLCFETRAGILKHCAKRNARKLGDVGKRFLINQRPSLEAQLTNLADEIAYNNHDVDDGLRSGLITQKELEEVSIFSRHLAISKKLYPRISERKLIHETVRSMINTLVSDLIKQSTANIKDARPDNLQSVSVAPYLISFSEEIKKEQQELKTFLRNNLYQHFEVARMSNKAQHTVKMLFNIFSEDTRLLPLKYQKKSHENKYQAIADYIAGMTDRYAIREYRRLFTIEEN